MIRPSGELILIKLDDMDEEIKLGNTGISLAIPDEYKRKPMRGVVVALGNKVPKENLDYKIGDKLLFGKFVGQDFSETKDDGAKYFYKVINYQDVIAVVEEE